MRALIPIALVVVLAVSALGGWRSDWAGILRLAGLWVGILLIRLIPFGRAPRIVLDRWGIALAAAAFLLFSGTGVFPTPTLGMPLFFLVHGSILIAYGALLATVFHRVRRDQKLDEDFMRVDLWVLNLGLCCVVFIALLDVFREQISIHSVLHALTKAMMLLGFLLLVLLWVRVAKEGRAGALLPSLLVAAITFSTFLGGARAFGVAYHLEMARRHIAARSPEAALAELEKARSSNEILRAVSAATREWTLRKEAYAATGRYDEALALAGESLLKRLTPPLPDNVSPLLQRYLSSAPIGRVLGARNPGVSVEDIDSMRRILESAGSEEEQLLVLFLENGQLDRLEERYAWSGLPWWKDGDSAELSLQRWRGRNPSNAWRADYFLGILAYREEWFASAQRCFEAVLAQSPDHANAVEWLARTQAREGDRDKAYRTSRMPRKVSPPMMVGPIADGAGKLAFYAALEVSARTYAFEFEVRGGASTARRRLFRAYLDQEKDAFAEAILKSSEWTRARAEREFLDEGRHRLLLVFEDVGEVPPQAEIGGEETLPFRGAEIRLTTK